MDNILKIHFSEDKIKPILFASKRRSKNVRQLNIGYKHINIKQHSQVTYLRCVLDEAKSKFLYNKNRYLTKELLTMLCNVLIQQLLIVHIQSAILNLNEKTKKEMQIMQNKCMRFCLKLDKMHNIFEKEFRLINWLPTSKRLDQCMDTVTYNFVDTTCGALRDLVSFVQFKKREKHPCFSRFLNCTNGTTSRKASHLLLSSYRRNTY